MKFKPGDFVRLHMAWNTRRSPVYGEVSRPEQTDKIGCLYVECLKGTGDLSHFVGCRIEIHNAYAMTSGSIEHVSPIEELAIRSSIKGDKTC